MNKDKLKTINWVGVGAAVLAFIFTFVPFCTVKATYYGYSLTQESCNFVKFNVMGILFLLAVIAAGVLYFLAGYMGNKQFDLFALIASAVAFLFLILALIIGNGDIKDLKELYDGIVTVKYSVGMYFEFIFAIVLVAAKWIDELVVKKYIIKGSNVYGSAPQGQYMNQQAPQQGQYMNQQAPQQGQYMNQQAPQQGQYMNQQAPQQGQFTNNNNNMQ